MRQNKTNFCSKCIIVGLPWWPSDKESPPANAGDIGSIPGWGRSSEGRKWQPTPYSYLENPWTEEPDGLQSKDSQMGWQQLSG